MRRSLQQLLLRCAVPALEGPASTARSLPAVSQGFWRRLRVAPAPRSPSDCTHHISNAPTQLTQRAGAALLPTAAAPQAAAAAGLHGLAPTRQAPPAPLAAQHGESVCSKMAVTHVQQIGRLHAVRQPQTVSQPPPLMLAAALQPSSAACSSRRSPPPTPPASCSSPGRRWAGALTHSWPARVQLQGRLGPLAAAAARRRRPSCRPAVSAARLPSRAAGPPAAAAAPPVAEQVMESGSRSFGSAREGMASPLAKKLFHIDGVTQVGEGGGPASRLRGPLLACCWRCRRADADGLAPPTPAGAAPPGLLWLRLCDGHQERGLLLGGAQARRLCGCAGAAALPWCALQRAGAGARGGTLGGQGSAPGSAPASSPLRLPPASLPQPPWTTLCPGRPS